MFCWPIIGHRIINRYITTQLNADAKSKLSPYYDILIKAEYGDLKDPDVVDTKNYETSGHTVQSKCLERAKTNLEKSKTEFNKKNYALAAYYLGFGLHYIEDMGCPVHRRNTHPTVQEVHTKYEKTPVINSEGVKTWSDLGFICSSYSSCPGYSNKITPTNISAAKERIDNLAGATVYGDNIVKNTALIEDIKRRVDLWATYMTNEYSTNNRLIYDMALAMKITHKYCWGSVVASTYFKS